MRKYMAYFALISAMVLPAFAGQTTAADKDQLQTANEIVTQELASDQSGEMAVLHDPVHPRMYICYSQDHHGYQYSAVGYSPHDTQHEAHHDCEHHSGGSCWDLGCRRY